MDDMDHIMKRLEKNRIDEQESKSKSRRINQIKSKQRRNAKHNAKKKSVTSIKLENNGEAEEELKVTSVSGEINESMPPIKREVKAELPGIKSENQVIQANTGVCNTKDEEHILKDISKQECAETLIGARNSNVKEEDALSVGCRLRQIHDDKYNANRMRQFCQSKMCTFCPRCREFYRCVVISKEQCKKIELHDQECWELLSAVPTDKKSSRELVQNVKRQLKVIHKPPKECLGDGSFAPGEVYRCATVDQNRKYMLSAAICGKAIAATINVLLPEVGEIDFIRTIKHNPYKFVLRTSDGYERTEDIRLLGLMLTVRAGSRIELGYYKAALDDSKDAVFCSPEHIESHWHVADASKMLGMSLQANYSFEEVLRLLCKQFNYKKRGTFFRNPFDYVFEITARDRLGQRLTYVRGGKKKTVHFWNQDEKELYEKMVYCRDGAVIPAVKFADLFVSTLQDEGMSHSDHVLNFFTKFARKELFTEDQWNDLAVDEREKAVEEGKLLYAYAAKGKFRVLSCMTPEQKHWEEHFIRWPFEVYIPTAYALKRDDALERQADEETMNSIVEQDSNEMMEEIRRLNEEQKMDKEVLLRRYFRRNTRSKP